MPLSHYLKCYPSEDQAGHSLLFSTKQASKAVVSNETLETARSSRLSPANERLLARLGMVVPDLSAERRSVAGFFDRCNACNPELNLIVVLNLDCNFACPYCFEGDRKGRHYMSRETAGDLTRFVRSHLTAQKERLSVSFYGGEPLLSTDMIISISRDLGALAAARKIDYRFNLISNGSLFNRRTAGQLKPLGLQHIKVTLDGPAEIHNRSRPFRSGAPSFDVIVANIEETCDLVTVNIGGNYTRGNYRSFVELLDFLAARGLGHSKIGTVKFDPVADAPMGELRPAGFDGGCRSVDEPWLQEADPFLREEILKRGYRTPSFQPITCMVETRDAYVVNFDGSLYKCPAFVGRPDYAVGTLRSGLADYDDVYRLDNWKNPVCLACEYLPLCYGGCRYMTLVRTGHLDGLDCQKHYLDRCLATYVRQEIKYGRTAGSGPG